ncbi:MAG TPA: hypothetical protein VFR67_31295, partial [Pilimelia sp.]|nr:hypothetical protein [Pilimelia sp.]
GLSLSTVPLSLLVGMLRHRVLDIDLILRRSVTYALLWLAIAGAYGGIAVFAGVAAGGRISVPVAVVVTIVTAMLFQPVRERLERFADRVVYGERLSGYELVRRFGATLGSAFAAAGRCRGGQLPGTGGHPAGPRSRRRRRGGGGGG